MRPLHVMVLCPQKQPRHSAACQTYRLFFLPTRTDPGLRLRVLAAESVTACKPVSPCVPPLCLDGSCSSREGRILVAVFAVRPDTEALRVGEHVLQQLGPLGVRASFGKLDGLVNDVFNLQTGQRRGLNLCACIERRLMSRQQTRVPRVGTRL